MAHDGGITGKAVKRKEALEYMEKAITLSSLGKAWAKLQEQTGDKETLQSLLDRATEGIRPEPPRKMQEIEAVQEDSFYTPLLKKQTWFNHPGLVGFLPGKLFLSTSGEPFRRMESW